MLETKCVIELLFLNQMKVEDFINMLYFTTLKRKRKKRDCLMQCFKKKCARYSGLPKLKVNSVRSFNPKRNG